MEPAFRWRSVPGLGFPLMRAVALISLSTGAVIDFAYAASSGKGTGEGSLLRGMLDTMNPGDILVADRYYPSFRTLASLQTQGVDIVSVSHQKRKVNFSDGVQLGENDHIVEWQRPTCMTRIGEDEFRSMSETIRVREFAIEIDDREGGTNSAVVVTTITDPTIPKSEISALYWKRWNCELDLRAIKQSMHLDILRCKTPEMVEKEIFAHLLAYNLLRGTMTESAKRNGLHPRQLSVKGAMQAIESFTPAMMSTNAGDVLYDALMTTVSAHRVGNRPGRLEPRAKKRKIGWQAVMNKPRNAYHRRLNAEVNPLR
jgi:hypothetical protein